MVPERNGREAGSDRTDASGTDADETDANEAADGTIPARTGTDRVDAGSPPAGSDPAVLVVDGQGTPASFEISVDGSITLESGSPIAEGLVVSGRTVEGAVESDTRRFHVTGEVTDVTLVNRGGLGDNVVDPEIYVEPIDAD